MNGASETCGRQTLKKLKCYDRQFIKTIHGAFRNNRTNNLLIRCG